MSESTRRVRRTLLAVSVGAIAVVELKLNFDTISVFGNVVAIQDRQWIVKAGELVREALVWKIRHTEKRMADLRARLAGESADDGRRAQ